jgi:hypothetical protein
MVWIGVDQQQLQRSKKKSRGIVGPDLGRSILAELGTQFLQHRRRAWNFGAADFQPLKLGEKTAARQRRQPMQKLLDLVAQGHCVSMLACD